MLAHKIRLDLSNKQTTYMKKACGISRKAWNWGLAQWADQYKQGLKPSGMALKKEFNTIKKTEFPYMYEVTKYAAQQPFIQLQTAWNKYFNYLKSKKGPKVGRPKFKKKGKCFDSFYIGGDQIIIKNKTVKIPNLGYVKLTEEVRFQGKILSATISRQADHWFISFVIEPLISFIPCKNHTRIGIDVGSKALATLSNGVQIAAPKPLRKSIRKLRRLSRQLSKKQHSRYKGDTTPKSKNYLKQQNKVARCHAKVSNIRKDTLHKLTTFLTDNFQYIAIEDLNIKGMMSNGKLARTIGDLGLYELKRQLLYKAKNKGNIVAIANRWFPSSKTCSCCGNIKYELTLKDRVYHCNACGLKIDRDLNASINLDKLNQIPQVLREFTTAEMAAMLARNGLVSSIVEPVNKHQPNLIIDRVG